MAIDPVVSLILRAAVALLFGWSAVEKLRDVNRFREAVEGYALLPPLWVVPAGAALIAVEIGVAAGVWLPRVGSVAAIAAAALLIVYAGAIGVNLVRGRRDIDCGCGGPAGRQTISAALVVRNVVLGAAAVVAALPTAPRGLHWVDWFTAVTGVAAAALLYVAADELLRLRRAAAQRIADEAVHA
jgi:hypothetical protein